MDLFRIFIPYSLSASYNFRIFVSYRCISKKCLMIAALMKWNIPPSGVISLLKTWSVMRNTHVQF